MVIIFRNNLLGNYLKKVVFIETIPTSPLKIFWECMFCCRVIFRSTMVDPSENCQDDLQERLDDDRFHVFSVEAL